MESFATKGGQFIVIGTVVDDQERPLDGTPVDIYINETKEHGGILLGSGETNDGVFQIPVQVPTDIPVGEYQVLAHAMPSGSYQDSWSDPPIVIGTETETALEGPDVVVVDTVASFGGSLNEEFGGPLAGQRMDLLIDNELVAITFTGRNGTFSFQHLFTDPGPAKVTVRFPGTDLCLSSQAEHNLRVVLQTSVALSAPESANMEQPVLFSGRLVDMFDSPIAGEEIILSSAGQGEIGRALTDEEGASSLEHAFNRGGALTIRARFAGTDLYLPSSAETSIDVFIITVLTLDTPEMLDVEQPALFSGTLTDTFGQGIARQAISLSTDGEFLGAATTDGAGYYAIIHTFQDEGLANLRASFLGEDLSLPSEAVTTVQVMIPTAILLELPEFGLVHHTTTLAGVLQDFRGDPLAGLPISLTIDDLEPQPLTTDAAGRFSLEHTFAQVGTYQIQVSFRGGGEGLGFLRPADIVETFPVITVEIETDIPPTLVRGETTTIGGTLTLGDAPRAGEAVTLLWDGQQIAEVLSQVDGAFSHDLAVNTSESLDNHRLTISVPSFQEETDVEVAVKARTSLSVAGPLDGHPDEKLTFKPTLLDDLGGPISQANISLDEHPISASTTDEGIATISFQVPEKLDVERLSLAFRFQETDKCLGSVALLGIDIVVARRALALDPCVRADGGPPGPRRWHLLLSAAAR